MSAVENELNSVKEYYNSDDFKDNYGFILMEDLQNYAVDRLIENSKTWDICNNREHPLSEESANKIVDYINEQFDDTYVREYRNYYVGNDCIASVEYGEQEHELENKFDKDKDNDCDFYIDDENRFAYYDMSSSGLYIIMTQEYAYEILDSLKDD